MLIEFIGRNKPAALAFSPCLMTATGTTHAGKVRIVYCKTIRHRTGNKIDLRAVEMRVELFHGCYFHPVIFIVGVVHGIEGGIEVQGILHPATSAAQNADP